MARRISERISEIDFIRVCKNANSMAQASADLRLHFNSFKKRAQELGVYNTNKAGKGIRKKNNGNKIPLQEILDGKHSSYSTSKLRVRLIKDGIKKHCCEVCGIEKWLNQPISLELDHIDGNRTNHVLSNLRIICPNCHSQTTTYRSKNNKN